MRLVIFSPITAASAIGRVTALVVGALVERGHDVVVVRSEDRSHLETPPRELPAEVRVVPWVDQPQVRDALHSADGVLYQVGNHYPFHRGCLEWLPRAPGIVCLHDYFLGSLFVAWARRNATAADLALRTWAPPDLAERYLAFASGESLIAGAAADAPMTEWIAAMAQGVLVHSSWGIARVLAACPGPVRSAPLPYDAPPMALGGDVRSGASSKFVVLTVGHMNPNKRMESVITAIGQSERLRSNVQYQLVGKIEEQIESRVRALATASGVELVIAGEVNDHELREAVARADVMCCLRLPALESASASIIEAMLYGKAVVVMDAGFSSELPDDVVRKVSPEREIEDLRSALEALERDPEDRRALGARAAAWSAETFRMDTYIDTLVELVSDVAAAAPALDAIGSFAETMVRWGASDLLISDPAITGPLQILG